MAEPGKPFKIKNKDHGNKSTYKLQSFHVTKYSTVKLDYQPDQIEFYDPYFILTYANQKPDDKLIPYIDIFEKTGEPVRRINISQILREHNLTMHNISHVKLPRLVWSERQNVEQLMALATKNQDYNSEEEDGAGDPQPKKKVHNLNMLNRLVIVGECFLGLDDPQEIDLYGSTFDDNTFASHH